MNTYFVAILNKSETISRRSIEELAAIPHLEYYFKIEVHQEVKNSFGNTEYYHKYTPVDSKGNLKIIDIGEFQITGISPETKRVSEIAGKRTYFTGKDILVYDKSTKFTNTYKQSLPVKNFLIDEFLYLIHTLTKIPDWQIFLDLKKIPLLEEEIKGLNEKIATQKEEIKKYKQPSKI